MSQRIRIRELDGIRGLASLGVVLFHYYHHFGTAPFYDILKPIYDHGDFLVDLFFVLSGYIISEVYIWHARYQSRQKAIASRIARLYPLHFITLIITIILVFLFHKIFNEFYIYQINDLYHFALNVILMQSSGLQKGFSYNGPSWSISTEMIVNVIFLLVVVKRKSIAFLTSTFFVAAFFVFKRYYYGMAEAVVLIGLSHCFFGFGMGGISRGLSAVWPKMFNRSYIYDLLFGTTMLGIIAVFIVSSP